MDHSAVARLPEDGLNADKMRLESFRLGRAPPASTNNLSGPKSGHARSHSRNGSVSVSLSLPTALSDFSTSNIDEPPSLPERHSLGASKRNSHHRRRSSVSTRRESADMMGVTLPSISPSSSGDNINLGDKDSVRRRALWALEGKTDMGSFSKVEIPEFDTTDSARRSFELPSKPSYPPGLGAGLSSVIGSKRDSLGKFMPSVSSKEQLDTLIEEEEEEEEEATPLVQSPIEDTAALPPPAAPARRRPASLNLRPLSLASGSVIDTMNGELPTPILTPSPNPRPGLRSLTLPSGVTNKRQSLILSQSPSPLSSGFARRPSLNLNVSPEPTSQQSFPQQSKRSSISYVSSADTPPSSVIGLPTPEMTPTTEGREAVLSTIRNEEMEQFLVKGPSRPLSTSEQHFLFQAHATLVQRITDLERALASRSSRSWSRPASCASDVSSAVSALSEPSDEMLLLIADLKAERDELKRDVDGWRVRVGDLERQVSVFAKRVEVERRDAWVARERVGLLEVEKTTLEQVLRDKAAEMQECQVQAEQAKARVQKAEAECEKLKEQVQKSRSAEEECVQLKAALEEERKKREQLEKDLEHAGLMDTPRAYEHTFTHTFKGISRTMMFAKKRGLGFQSMDSESSFTDVESVDTPNEKLEFGLNAVAEEDEETLSNYSEQDELARFEEEEEGDADVFPPSMSASSFGSESDPHSPPVLHIEIAEQAPELTRSTTSSPSPLPSPVEQTHQRRVSLSKTWTFPSGSGLIPIVSQKEEIDHFFGCLEDVDNSPPLHARVHSLDSAKNLFAQAFADDDDDDLPPFVLPADVGVEVPPEIKEEPKHVLDVVVEEDEEEEEEDQKTIDPDDEFEGEVYEGGIKFTFTVPPEYQQNLEATVPSTPVAQKSPPVIDPFEEEDSSFTFPQARSRQGSVSPSSIPRLASAKSSSIPVSSGTPVKSVLTNRSDNIPSAFMTPPNKRGGATSKFIPQPWTQTGSPLKSPTRPNAKAASFIPQPRRVSSPARPSAIPVMSPPTTASSSSSRSTRTVTSRPPSASPRMESHTLPEPATPSRPEASVQLSSTFMSMSPTIAARLSFQTLTNFIPLPSLPWSPRTARTAAAAAAMCFVPESHSNSNSIGDVREHARSDSAFVNPSSDATPPSPKERTYVPREKQLEKLRLRMELERRLQSRGASSAGQANTRDGVSCI